MARIVSVQSDTGIAPCELCITKCAYVFLCLIACTYILMYKADTYTQLIRTCTRPHTQTHTHYAFSEASTISEGSACEILDLNETQGLFPCTNFAEKGERKELVCASMLCM